MHSGSWSADRLPECFAELTCPCSGLWQLDIKDLNLYGCEKLFANCTVDRIVLHFKNIEALDIGDTDISVLPEGDLKFSNLLVAECFWQ